jgi:hypothetical protein
MRFKILAVAAAVTASPAFANEFEPALRSFLDNEIRDWSQAEEIVSAILSQNEAHEGMDEGRIQQLDSAWMAEIGAAETPTITPVIENPVADFLRDRIAASGGRITEIFVMDAHGLNVAASSITSDMWQGDEAKFTETYAIGADAYHFSEVELDESTQTYQAQISITIVDPATGAPIGAMTVGVDAEALL